MIKFTNLCCDEDGMVMVEEKEVQNLNELLNWRYLDVFRTYLEDTYISNSLEESIKEFKDNYGRFGDIEGDSIVIFQDMVYEDDMSNNIIIPWAVEYDFDIMVISGVSKEELFKWAEGLSDKDFDIDYNNTFIFEEVYSD